MTRWDCGTRAGWNAHQVADEPICQDCRDAHAEYVAERRGRPRPADLNPKDELLAALRLERFGKPVPEFRNARVDVTAEATALRLVSDERGVA